MVEQCQNIGSLAAERHAEKGQKEKLNIAFHLGRSHCSHDGAIVSIVAPMGTIFVGTSRTSINDLSSITIQVAATQASQGVETAISNTARVLDQLMTSPYFPADFIQNGSNILRSPTLLPAMLTGLRTFDYISAIVCANPGPTAIGPFGPFTNNSNIQALWTPFLSTNGTKQVAVIYADASTNATNQLRVYASDLTTVTRTGFAGPKGVQTRRDLLFTDFYSAIQPINPYFGLTLVNTSGVSFWQMSYYRHFYRAGAATPAFGCSIGYIIDEALVPFLNSVRVTNNTIVILAEKNTALLIATNRRDSLAINSTRVTADMSPHPDVALVGKGLFSIYGNISTITNETVARTPVWQRKLDDGQEWFLSSSIINVRGTEFILAIAFPRSDMFSKIDSAERQGLVIAVCVAVAGTLLTGALTFLALRPLHNMALSMKQLTKFDFSSLENGALERRSLMAEIREVEVVFDTMVVAFASAIKKNKALVSGGIGSTVQKTSGHRESISPPTHRESMSQPSRN
ncbi:hypothetical protein BC829DRAFT_398073 [Chytridium lagenaria]|nr:hypothetical protein BC829DRAFT_398073 [Chytridium lagenaria]